MFSLPLCLAGFGLARRLPWPAVRVVVWKKFSGQMPAGFLQLLGGGVGFWWLFSVPCFHESAEVFTVVLKALLCCLFSSLWQSRSVGLATPSFLSLIIMTVFVKVILYQSIHPCPPVAIILFDAIELQRSGENAFNVFDSKM